MPNCSHSSLTVKRALCTNITNRIISSIGLTVFQDIMLGTVTHHPGSFVTYHSGSYRRRGREFEYLSRQTPAIAVNMQQQLSVAKFLKLLAYLRLDVSIVRMQLFQLRS